MKITLLDPETAAAIRADNDGYIARLKPYFDAFQHDGYGFDVRHKGGHITLLNKDEVEELSYLMRLATWTVKVQYFDVSDDPDFGHDEEWIVSFTAV